MPQGVIFSFLTLKTSSDMRLSPIRGSPESSLRRTTRAWSLDLPVSMSLALTFFSSSGMTVSDSTFQIGSTAPAWSATHLAHQSHKQSCVHRCGGTLSRDCGRHRQHARSHFLQPLRTSSAETRHVMEHSFSGVWQAQTTCRPETPQTTVLGLLSE